jgi:hypothetical protein
MIPNHELNLMADQRRKHLGQKNEALPARRENTDETRIWL